MFSPLAEMLPDLRDLYQDLHRHPELSFAESRTAGELGHHLRDLGYEVTTGVGPAPAGRVLSRPGLMMAASDSLRVRLFGRGGHAAKPESTVDTVVMAAATVLRLQTVVSREIPATESAVVTVARCRRVPRRTSSRKKRS
jgi:metal-dependent amidase/aminoacylase/carboxypeptidase family protein